MAAAGAAIPLLVTLGGAALQYAAQSDAGRRKSHTIQDMQRDNEAFGEKNRQLTQDLATQYDPATRKVQLEQLVGKREASIADAQKQADANLTGTGTAGKISDAVTTTKASTALTEAQRKVNLTRILAKTLAPQDLQTEEGFKAANTAGVQRGLQSDLGSRNAAHGYALNTIQPNGLANFGGAVAQGVGTGMAYSNYQDKLDKLYSGLFAGSKTGIPGNFASQG